MKVANEAGFTLVEVLVAFTILILSLAGLYAAASGAYRSHARGEADERALSVARSHLANLGIETEIMPGTQTGSYDNGLAWHLVVTPVDADGEQRLATRAFWVSLRVSDRRGASLIELQTAKVAPVPR